MATFTSAAYDGRYMQLSISESVDAVSNTSTLYWTLSSVGGSVSYYTVDATTVTINGTQVYYKARTSWDDRVFPAAKGSVSGSITVPHNSDGTKKVTVVFSTRVYVYGPVDYGGSMTLTNIDRTAPTVSFSVSNITATGFKITASSSATADTWHYSTNNGSSWTQFSTTAGTSASVTLSSLSPNTTYSVRVRVKKKSNQVYGTSALVSVKTLGGAAINSCSAVTADAATVTLTMNVTVYNAAYSNYVTIKNGSTEIVSFSARTWAVGTANRSIMLTSEQRTALLEAMSDVKSFTATIALVTKSGTEQIGSTSTSSCLIQTTEANSAPTMTSFSVRDSRSATVAVTGNSQLFIQGYSYVYVTPGTATAKNGASIVKYAAACNGVTYSNTTGAALNLYTVSKSGSLDVVVTATDSRGYTVSTSQQIAVIPYEKPKVSEMSLRRTNDIEAEMQLVFKGSLSPITVNGTQKNSLLYVQYRYKLTSASSYGSYTTITSAVTQSGSSFSYSNLELCSLDANSSYDFNIYIRDKLNSLSGLNLYFTVPQGTPLVALRKKKVGINTPSPEAALHVVGNAVISGSLTASSLAGTLPTAKLSGTVPITKGGTGATTASAACSNIGALPKSGGTVTGGITSTCSGLESFLISHGETNGEAAFRASRTDTGVGVFMGVGSGGTNHGVYSLKLNKWIIYADSSNVYCNGNAINVTGTVTVGHGGTGSTSASGARTNLGIYCTSLYSGSLSSGSITFNYGSYKAYAIVGQPSTSASRMSLIIPKGVITTSDISWQIADEVNYRGFKLKYSGSTVTLTIGNGTGYINNVYGIN